MLSDADGELARGLEVVEFACGIPALLKGGFSESVSTQIDVTSIRQPLGVCAVITPFNFPAMVPLWFAPIAIACGNTVVLKPSEKDPSAALLLAECWAEAGLPDGVFNVVHGDAVAVDRLLTHPDVAAVSFVGSTPVARHVYETGTGTASGSRPSAGPRTTWWCCPTPTSTPPPTRRCRPASARPGSGAWPSRSSSPSTRSAMTWSRGSPSGWPGCAPATAGAAATWARWSPLPTGTGSPPTSTPASQAGAKLVVDGRGRSTRATAAATGSGSGRRCSTTCRPTARSTPTRSSGRCSAWCGRASFDQALDLVNASPYGNGTALFTSDGALARRYQSEVEVGMVGINVPIPVPAAAYSFGGWKASLFGDTHAYGPDGVHFFTRSKVVTSRWPHAAAPRAQLDLNFPGNC